MITDNLALSEAGRELLAHYDRGRLAGLTEGELDLSHLAVTPGDAEKVPSWVRAFRVACVAESSDVPRVIGWNETLRGRMQLRLLELAESSRDFELLYSSFSSTGQRQLNCGVVAFRSCQLLQINRANFVHWSRGLGEYALACLEVYGRAPEVVWTNGHTAYLDAQVPSLSAVDALTGLLPRDDSMGQSVLRHFSDSFRDPNVRTQLLQTGAMDFLADSEEAEKIVHFGDGGEIPAHDAMADVGAGAMIAVIAKAKMEAGQSSAVGAN